MCDFGQVAQLFSSCFLIYNEEIVGGSVSMFFSQLLTDILSFAENKDPISLLYFDFPP